MKKLNIPIQTALTNADRIRSMTDIELAEFLSTMVSSCDYCVHDVGCTIYTNRNRCREGVLEYLKEGAKEEAESEGPPK